MSQYDFGTIDPNTKSGTALATDLNSWRNALHSTHGGSSAPSYITAGMLWLDTTSANYRLKLYDGAQSIDVGIIDATNNVARVAIDSAATSYITATTAAQIKFVIASVDTATIRSTGLQFNIASPYIGDSSNNELLSFSTTASAVNQINVANAATGTNPVISAVGNDTNIGITLTPKGTGRTNIGQLALDGTTITTSAAELNYVNGVTSAIQTQLDAKAALASPALTGTPTAPTASNGTNTTQIATTAFVLANGGAAYYNQDAEPSSPSNGALWYQPSAASTYIRSNSVWFLLSGTLGVASDRGLFAAGDVGADNARSSSIDAITISTNGNSASFGNLTIARNNLAGASNGPIGVFAGGNNTAGTAVNTIDSITIATRGTAGAFGNLTLARTWVAGVSNATRGVFGGGFTGSAVSLVMDYIAIATASNATSFGNLTVGRYFLAGLSNATRGVFGGGIASANSLVMDYITVATTGNATNFGNLTLARYALAGVSNATRGVFGGGDSGTRTAVMDYITVATAGNATSFGNLTVARGYSQGVSNATRGVFAGGYTATAASSAIDYITVATTGNATSFGNLSVARNSGAGVSGTIPT